MIATPTASSSPAMAPAVPRSGDDPGCHASSSRFGSPTGAERGSLGHRRPPAVRGRARGGRARPARDGGRRDASARRGPAGRARARPAPGARVPMTAPSRRQLARASRGAALACAVLVLSAARAVRAEDSVVSPSPSQSLASLADALTGGAKAEYEASRALYAGGDYLGALAHTEGRLRCRATHASSGTWQRCEEEAPPLPARRGAPPSAPLRGERVPRRQGRT